MRMSPANVYRFFDSKATLREALAERLTGQVESACVKVLRGAGSVAERFRSYVVEAHRMTRDRYASSENVNELMDVAMRDNWKVVDEHMKRMMGHIRDVIDDGVKSGEFRVSDPDKAARMVFFALVVFVDPSHMTKLFKDDNDLSEARNMSVFLSGALQSGCI
jgi:AcrR family transcriptional regulator